MWFGECGSNLSQAEGLLPLATESTEWHGTPRKERPGINAFLWFSRRADLVRGFRGQVLSSPQTSNQHSDESH